ADSSKARATAMRAPGSLAQSPTFQLAEERQRDIERFERAGRLSDAIHAATSASDLYLKSVNERAPVASNNHSPEQPTNDQNAADQRLADQRAADQRAADQRAAEQRLAEQRAAEQRAADQRAAEQRNGTQ